MDKEKFFCDVDKDDPDTYGQCGDNVYWKVTDGVLYIGGDGDMWDYDDSCEEYYHRRPFFGFYDDVVILEGVTSIGRCAFFEGHIRRISIPKSVKIVRELAFFKCVIEDTLDLSDSLQRVESFILGGDPCDIGRLEVSFDIPEIHVEAFYNRCLAPDEIVLKGRAPKDVSVIVDSDIFGWIPKSIKYPKSWDADGENFFNKLERQFRSGRRTSFGIEYLTDQKYFQQLKNALMPV